VRAFRAEGISAAHRRRTIASGNLTDKPHLCRDACGTGARLVVGRGVETGRTRDTSAHNLHNDYSKVIAIIQQIVSDLSMLPFLLVPSAEFRGIKKASTSFWSSRFERRGSLFLFDRVKKLASASICIATRCKSDFAALDFSVVLTWRTVDARRGSLPGLAGPG
jgi:hypothetical protein